MEIIVVHDREAADPSLARLSAPGPPRRLRRSTPARAASAAPATPVCWRPVATSSPAATTTTCGTPRRSVCRSSGSSPTRPAGRRRRDPPAHGRARRTSTWPAREAVISHERLLENRVKELHSSTLMMRRSAFDVAGLYDEELPHGYGEDYDWLLRASRVGSVGAVQEILADIRKDVPSWFRGALAQHRHRAGVPARQASRLPGPATRSRPDPGADRLRARPAAGERAPGRAHRRACAVPLPGAHRTPGSRSPWPGRGSSPVGCSGRRAPAGTGPVVNRLPNFLYVGPDKAGSSWLHEMLLKHPDVYLTPAKDLYFFDRYYDRGPAWYAAQFRDAREREVVGEVCQDYLFHPEAAGTHPRRRSARSGSWCRCATRSSARGRRTSTCASTASGPTPSARRCSSRPELLEHGRYATGLDRFLAALPAGAGPRRALRRPDATTRSRFLDGVTGFLGIDDLPLADEDLAARLPAGQRPVRPRSPPRRAAARTGSASTTARGWWAGSSDRRSSSGRSTGRSTGSRPARPGRRRRRARRAGGRGLRPRAHVRAAAPRVLGLVGGAGPEPRRWGPSYFCA